MTQKETNPFAYSDTNKRYHTYDYYLRKRFGFKVAKLSIDGGFTCPNLDGTCGTGGCIYCSKRGSGDFTGEWKRGEIQSVSEQIASQKSVLFEKWGKPQGYIAYFQARTNTYAPVDILKEKYEEALAQPDILGLNVATRADCLPCEVLAYLSELSERTELTVELGLQSSNDQTAQLIHRGHTFAQFLSGFEALRAANSKIRICVHIIFGLPGESKEDMMQTVKEVARLRPEEVKIHLLHVIKGTEMDIMYQMGRYKPLNKDEYTSLVVDALEVLPADIVVERLTGDGKKEDLSAPLWSLDKRRVLNDIDSLFYQRNSYQGIKYKQENRR